MEVHVKQLSVVMGRSCID